VLDGDQFARIYTLRCAVTSYWRYRRRYDI